MRLVKILQEDVFYNIVKTKDIACILIVSYSLKGECGFVVIEHLLLCDEEVITMLLIEVKSNSVRICRE